MKMYCNYQSYGTFCYKHVYPNMNNEITNCPGNYCYMYIHNEDGYIIGRKASCDGNFDNCSYNETYEVDEHGNIVKETTPEYSKKIKIEYDNSGNMIYWFDVCSEDYGSCAYGYKYDYENGKKTAQYDCNYTTRECKLRYQYKYDEKNNLISSVDPSGTFTNEFYNYDYKNGHISLKYAYYGCNGEGENCVGLTKTEYDENGNEISVWHCSVDGESCNSSGTYSYVYYD